MQNSKMITNCCFHMLCVLQAQQMTMQAIAFQQQMLSSFPPVAPAPQSPPSHHTNIPSRSHTPSPVSERASWFANLLKPNHILASSFSFFPADQGKQRVTQTKPCCCSAENE